MNPGLQSTLLVIDVVESVRLMEANEKHAVRQWQALVEQVVQQVLPRHGGRLVKSLGDGLMLEFSSARSAVQASLNIQNLCEAANQSVPLQERMHLRAGVHSAQYVTDDHDIYGADVNLAVRLTTLAGPGETIVSAPVRDELTPELDGDIEDLGDCYMKHLVKPVRAYRVGDAGAAPIILPGSNRPLDLRPTIAVIPFTGRGTDPGHALIGEAVADELIAALSKTAELHVISRLSTTVFRDRRASDEGALSDIRRHLAATYVLSGRCTVVGSNVNVFVELAEAEGGRIVWADSLKSTVNGLFNPDDDMLSRVVAAVSSAVMRHELQRAQNHALPTLEGYTLLMAAVAMMHRSSPTDFDQPREMLEHLVERARRHPVPYAWLAKWYVLKVNRGWTQDATKDSQTAIDLAKRALEIEPKNSLALTIDGFAHTNLKKDTDTGSQRYLEAIDANPNDSLAWLLMGTLHAFKGDGAKAMKGTSHALKLSPLDPLRYFYESLAATAALADRNYELALVLANKSLRSNRMHTSTWRALAIANIALGNEIDAREAVRNLLRLEPDSTVRKFLDRSPSAQFWTGDEWSQALARASLPD